MSNAHPEPPLDGDGLPVPDPDFRAKRRQAFQDYLDASATLGDDSGDGFDLYARDPGEFRDLSARIPGLLVHSAGGACPFQSEGTLHGYPYYFRYRSGVARLRVMDPARAKEDWFESLYQAALNYGHPLDGALDRQQFADLMVRLVPQLERAPFRYQFRGVKVDVEDIATPTPENGQGRPLGGTPEKRERRTPDLRFTATDIPETYCGWGRTPAEALADLAEPSPILLKHGWTAEKQHEMHLLRAIDPTPLDPDRRVFPDPEPVFEVRAEER